MGRSNEVAYRGNLASFYPKSRQHESLMFHVGAQISGKHPRLEGSGGTSRVMKIGSVAEANAAKGDLEGIMRAWCEWRDSLARRELGARAPGGTMPLPRKRTAKETPSSHAKKR